MRGYERLEEGINNLAAFQQFPVHRKKACLSARLFSLSKNKFFDRLAEVKEAAKTSNATPKCMWILERGALRSKSKCLAQQGIFTILQSSFCAKIQILLHKEPFYTASQNNCILTVGGFFDTLRRRAFRHAFWGVFT